MEVKITDSEVIKTGEGELIDTIIGELDWSAIEEIFKDKHRLRIQDDVEYKQGDIVVHNNDVAFQLDFDVKVMLSILFDRTGNYLNITTSGDFSESGESEVVNTAVQSDENLAPIIPESSTGMPMQLIVRMGSFRWGMAFI